MTSSRIIGIIDIGSNSIRLAIYELTATGGYRVVGEFKESARLSSRIVPDGSLPEEEIQRLVNILARFKRIGDTYKAGEYRVAATAAVRNASNSDHIREVLRRETGLPVEILSGEDEARIGFLGMIRTMDVKDGILVDIGGGSTEVSLFRERKLLRSVSFPFGAVNTTRKFSQDGEFGEAQLNDIRRMVEESVDAEPWIRECPGLPLIGLGGGVRTLCKISQRRRKYSFPQTHHYTVPAEEMDGIAAWLPSLPAEKRKKVDGLSKDRYDIIIPGVIILQTLFRLAGATQYIVSGAGLRDGLFFESFAPRQPAAGQVAEFSAANLLALHSTAPAQHIEQVRGAALKLYDALEDAGCHQYPERMRLCFGIAAMLYRIGASLQYYQYPKHSFHLISQTRIDGLTHREMLLCAFIASYKAKNRTQQVMSDYKDILPGEDLELVAKLGELLHLAVALDISETQALELVEASADAESLQLGLRAIHDPSAEYREVAALQKDFKKLWGLQLKPREPLFSMS
ncbi:exopolyphosphatase / guanosine-5'-triphosphate,3'-diphosphate pyrophosphatase [Paenibacillus sp. UNCCL117]|uniref:Ppx/GppA phosphatase family protein n=1 Tax=unclassified Paenibacillus TaxID=185978 RepID=UPI0008873AF3|nr:MULTISPECIES: Ppx/GppA phosphatase family protein [unclassified Paenibacillus]SDC08981.1 exopolyphosphatase / guanosine-5'-triphosphate,3'-diphosphate pyrophosphatase [Paenibacillus sp. cl123]SFW38367.1 exopolyphosphatase / guanosine-5'-triphosphate,3'-diphosphate pyrophosphatase [Paenibacillus sp. UNCCL117]